MTGKFIKEENRFPQIISKYFNAEVNIDALGGASNKRAMRKIFYEYDMNEYDFIIIDFPPENRTEFYNSRTKEWERYHITLLSPNLIKNSDHLKSLNKRMETYYQHIYNSEYGLLQEKINFMAIKKYLTAINKPHIMISSATRKKDIPYDFYIIDYEMSKEHLTKEGHQTFAKDIIKYYENILQR